MRHYKLPLSSMIAFQSIFNWYTHILYSIKVNVGQYLSSGLTIVAACRNIIRWISSSFLPINNFYLRTMSDDTIYTTVHTLLSPPPPPPPPPKKNNNWNKLQDNSTLYITLPWVLSCTLQHKYAGIATMLLTLILLSVWSRVLSIKGGPLFQATKHTTKIH